MLNMKHFLFSALVPDSSIPTNAVEDSNLGFKWGEKYTYPGFYLDGDDEEVWIENAVQSTAPGNAASDWSFEGKQSTPSN